MLPLHWGLKQTYLCHTWALYVIQMHYKSAFAVTFNVSHALLIIVEWSLPRHLCMVVFNTHVLKSGSLPSTSPAVPTLFIWLTCNSKTWGPDLSPQADALALQIAVNSREAAPLHFELFSHFAAHSHTSVDDTLKYKKVKLAHSEGHKLWRVGIDRVPHLYQLHW